MLIMYEAAESCRFVINLSYSFYQIYAQNQVNFGQRCQNRHAINRRACPVSYFIIHMLKMSKT